MLAICLLIITPSLGCGHSYGFPQILLPIGGRGRGESGHKSRCAHLQLRLVYAPALQGSAFLHPRVVCSPSPQGTLKIYLFFRVFSGLDPLLLDIHQVRVSL